MKLLIVTQKVDQNDAVLGFFHRWLLEFAKHCEHVAVICLGKGEFNLPKNVSVYSLGKEEGVSKLTYIVRFYSYIWRLRREYDQVFVHMNPEYVALGGVLWRAWNKKVLMWYNHPQGNLWINIASIFAHRMFHTSPFAYAQKFAKAVQVPAGIDTNTFKRNASVSRREHSILSLGRISKIKHVDDIVRACDLLGREERNFALSVYGDPGPDDDRYYKKIRKTARELEVSGKVTFHSEIRNNETPAAYSAHEIFVNATPTGSFDKTILEAMACECLVVVSNRSFADTIPSDFLFAEGDVKNLASVLKHVLDLSKKEKDALGKEYRKYVVQNHGLDILVKQLLSSV